MAAAMLQTNRTILIMDDDPMILDLATNILTELGYNVQTCTTGEEAVELYRQAQQTGVPFAAAVMDLTIPGAMGGKEAARLILKQCPEARLVVSNGYSNDPIMANYLSHGFCAAMVKPYDVSALTRMLKELLAEAPNENRNNAPPHKV